MRSGIASFSSIVVSAGTTSERTNCLTARTMSCKSSCSIVHLLAKCTRARGRLEPVGCIKPIITLRVRSKLPARLDHVFPAGVGETRLIEFVRHSRSALHARRCNVLEDGSHPLTAADARRLQPVASAATVQLTQQGGQGMTAIFENVAPAGVK